MADPVNPPSPEDARRQQIRDSVPKYDDPLDCYMKALTALDAAVGALDERGEDQ